MQSGEEQEMRRCATVEAREGPPGFLSPSTQRRARERWEIRADDA